MEAADVPLSSAIDDVAGLDSSNSADVLSRTNVPIDPIKLCWTENTVDSNSLSEKMSNLNKMTGQVDFESNAQSPGEEPSMFPNERLLESLSETIKPLNGIDKNQSQNANPDTLQESLQSSSELMDLGKQDSPRPTEELDNSTMTSVSDSSVNISLPMPETGIVSQDSLQVNNALTLSGDSLLLRLREESMRSNNNSGQDGEEPVNARDSMALDLSAHANKSDENYGIKPIELSNPLIEGPRITLPPTQLPLVSPQPAVSDTLKTEQQSLEAASFRSNSQSYAPQTSVPHCTSNCSHIKKEQHSDQLISHVEKKDITGSSSQEVVDKSKLEDVKEPISSSKLSTSPPALSASTGTPSAQRMKKTPNDFVFGKVIGEGSYSTVYLAKEVNTQKEFAVKVCDKKHLIRERKTHFVMREKEVLMKLDHPFFIKLAYTFQDPERLYYVLTYARNGELLGYLHKLSVFDVPCTRFYTAEIVLALEYLHTLGIVHRDLKPENILLSEDMHIKITDFGTSKILSKDCKPEVKRKNSFVGTAEYVSPEVLNNQPANFGSDLWALGCIIYQCLSGSMPFRSGNEYQTFQKIVKSEYDFPEGFHPAAKDLVEKLLVLEPEKRLGVAEPSCMDALKQHHFYEGIQWESLPQSSPPKLMPYLPATASNPEFWGQDNKTGFDDQRLAEIITGQTACSSQSPELEEVVVAPVNVPNQGAEEERQRKMRKQRLENPFHNFVEDNLILRQGFVDKRKGFFARKRMLLLTEGPHLYYVDAHNKVLKGEIPWSAELRPEAKNFKIFFVHTPNRTYYLESRLPDAQMWVKKIDEVWKRYYGQDG